MTRQQNKRGCGSTFLGCFGAGVLLLAVTGAALYFVAPKVLKDADSKILPWLESKGRVLVGKFALQPLIHTVDQSELSSAEKKEWKEFLAEKWEVAHSSQDQTLRREDLINAARETVGSYSGIYYALLAVGDRDFDDTTLTDRQIETGQKLISTTTANMLDGVYAIDELTPFVPDLLSVIAGWRTATKNEKGRRERDNNIRDFFRALLRLNQEPTHQGDNQGRDMHAEFQQELARFKQRIVDAEAEHAL